MFILFHPEVSLRFLADKWTFKAPAGDCERRLFTLKTGVDGGVAKGILSTRLGVVILLEDILWYRVKFRRFNAYQILIMNSKKNFLQNPDANRWKSFVLIWRGIACRKKDKLV